jgi:hypothetical protein
MTSKPAVEASVSPEPAVRADVGQPAARPDGALGDLRFRALLSADEWQALSPAVRHRFSRRLAGGNTIVYVGKIVETRFSRLGWLFAQLARLIGGPLPIARDVDVPSVVSVTEDMAANGQIWTRLYARRKDFPQIVHSSKRFGGPTGLEEHVGCGVGMVLDIRVRDGVLLFLSNFYFIDIAGLRLRLPHWTTPGAITVAHSERGEGEFSFTLDVIHPRFGELIHQVGIFRETRS